MVSVPCVITAPLAPSATALEAAATARAIAGGSRFTPGTFDSCSTRSSASSASSGTAATRSAPLSAARAGEPVMAIVPPVATSCTTGSAIRGREATPPDKVAPMEASAQPAQAERRRDSEKAQRIIAAMRESVGTRGAAGATFDHVAREAGVSRGLLHYYFGSKERLLVEVVRRDTEVRVATLERNLTRARSVDEIIAALVLGLEEFIEGEPTSPAVIYELLSASRHSDEIRAELAEL